MEGADAGKVRLNCVGLKTPVGEVGDPLRNGFEASGEIDARRGEDLGIKHDEIEVGSLTSGVRAPGAGGKAVPQIERRASREASVRLIPVIRDFVDEEVLGRCAASWKSLEYWKRDAASAIALSTVEIQEEEKEKFKNAESIEIIRRIFIERGDLPDPELSHTTTAWLSTLKLTCAPSHKSPQRRMACKTAYVSLN